MSEKRAKHLFVTGAAGCGKTYAVRAKIDADPTWGLLTATTGVAARNLGDSVPTLNSALGFFDLASLRRLSARGDITHAMRRISKRHARLVIDEASMLTREALEILHENASKVGLGLVLVGDFLQLPPVVVDNETERPWWAFQANCWNAFSENLVWLQKNHRQTDALFLDGLNHLRAQRGSEALARFKQCGVNFTTQAELDYRFPGTTIVGTNAMRQSFNARMYGSLTGGEFIYRAERWGKQRQEWKKEIPESVSLKVDARVMILQNKKDDDEGLLYANGDTGTVRCLTSDCATVERDRDGAVLEVSFAEKDDAEIIGHAYEDLLDPDTGKSISRRVIKKSPATGGVKFMPLTQAWAITVHKSQGLTLGAVQVNLPEPFYGHPAMVYTACSRCKTPENLVLVGGDRYLVQRTRMDQLVRGWIEPPRAA